MFFHVHVDFDAMASFEFMLFKFLDFLLQSKYLDVKDIFLALDLMFAVVFLPELLMVLVDVDLYPMASFHREVRKVDLLILELRDGRTFGQT